MTPYLAATTAVACVDITSPVWITVTGNDARKFLNNTLSNNIKSLPAHGCCYTVVLTPKGKIIGDLWCYGLGDSFALAISRDQTETLLSTLSRYIIFNKVALDQKDNWSCLTLVGPHAILTVTSWLSVALDAESTISTADCVITRTRRWNLDWIEIWGTSETLQSYRDRAALLPTLDAATQEILRIESATPKMGVDMNDTTLPQEAGLHHALSFTKGCYIGQEIVTRLEHRGHVGKQLRLLKWDGATPPVVGDEVYTQSGEKAGTITSLCFSHTHNTTVALAMMAYRFLKEPSFKNWTTVKR